MEKGNKILTSIFNEKTGDLDVLQGLSHDILEAEKEISRTINRGNKVLICGNGGSAADAQHFAAELVGRYLKERDAISAIALTTDSSILTAIANDYGFVHIFRRQIEALGKDGDLLFAISTSGNSGNVINAIETAKRIGLKVITLLGKDGGKIKGSGDTEIIIPYKKTPRIQELHITIIHILCELLENEE